MRTRRISNPEACPRVRRTWAPRGQTPTLVTRFARTPRLGGPSCRNDPGTPAGHTGTDPPGRRNCMHPEPRSPNHRTRGRWIIAGATVMALLAASCAGTSGSSASGGAATTSSAPAPVVTTEAPKPLKQPGARCGAPRTKATLVRFEAADGTSLDGVMVGSGTTGVVLAHEYLADLCGAWPFADYDAYTTVEETRAMHQAAKVSDKRLEVLSGELDGRHGWGLLTDVGTGGFSSAATTVTEFITAHTR